MKNKQTKIAIHGDASLTTTISFGPAIAAIRATTPEAEITFVAPEAMREAVGLLPGVDVFTSDASTVVAEKHFTLGSSSQGEFADWKAYREGPAQGSEGNPYHEIDLLRKITGHDLVDVNFELLPPELDDSSLPSTLISGDEGLRVAVCVSSLELPELEAVLSSLANLTIPREVFLIGTVADKKKSASLLASRDGQLAIHDLCGRLSFAAGAQVLRHSDICLTGPGASALLSSGYGTFTVCLDNQPKRGPRHYPYGHGHLVVQAAPDQDFSSAISTIVGEILTYAVSANSGTVPSLEQWQAFADERLDEYLGRIRLVATQRVETVLAEEHRLTELYVRPLIFLGAELTDVMSTFYRLLWEHSLSARTFTSDPVDILHQNTIADLRALLPPLEKLFALSNFGRNYCQLVKQALVEGKMEQAKEASDKVQEVEELVFQLGESFPALLPLCSFHHKCQSHIPELDPANLADEMSEVFTDLQSRVLVVLDLAQTLFHTTFQSETARRADSSSSQLEG